MNNEIWSDISEWEGEYRVSNMGRIKSLEREIQYSDGRIYKIKEKILKANENDKGYLIVVLSRNQNRLTRQVHRLVALSFIPNPENKRTVNHKLGNILDNRASELEWATHSEQQKHAYRVLGRVKNMKGRTGERHPAFGKTGVKHAAFGVPGYWKGKENIARMSKIRCDTLDLTFKSLSEASEKLGVSRMSVRRVCIGEKIDFYGLDLRYL